MSNRWDQSELDAIIAADDLRIAPFRADGVTCGTPTWIWCVAVDGELYVRGYNGTASRWYQAALRQRAGQITAAGQTRSVVFEAADGQLADRIDGAYRKKYGGSRYLKPMIGSGPRAATIRVIPRDAN